MNLESLRKIGSQEQANGNTFIDRYLWWYTHAWEDHGYGLVPKLLRSSKPLPASYQVSMEAFIPRAHRLAIRWTMRELPQKLAPQEASNAWGVILAYTPLVDETAIELNAFLGEAVFRGSMTFAEQNAQCAFWSNFQTTVPIHSEAWKVLRINT